MTREEAKKIALDRINEEIEKHGENSIYMESPMRGKNSWTLREAKESILEDKELEGSDTNLIDAVLNLDRYIKEQVHKIKEKNEQQ